MSCTLSKPGIGLSLATTGSQVARLRMSSMPTLLAGSREPPLTLLPWHLFGIMKMPPISSVIQSTSKDCTRSLLAAN